MVFLVVIFVVAVLFVFVVIAIVIVFVVIAISLVFTFMGGSHVVDSAVLVFACFVGPVIVVIVVTVYVVCLLWLSCPADPKSGFFLGCGRRGSRCPARRRRKEKRGGVGGTPPLSSSLSPTHNHIAVRPRADVLSPINHGQPDTRWSVLYFICGQREPDKNTFTLYTMLQLYVDKDDKDTAKSPRAFVRKHINVQGRLAALPHTR